MSSILGIFFKTWWSRNWYKIFSGTVNVGDGELLQWESPGRYLHERRLSGDTSWLLPDWSWVQVLNLEVTMAFFPLSSPWGVDYPHVHLSRSDLSGSLPLQAFGCPLLSLCHALYLKLISVLSRSSLFRQGHCTRSQANRCHSFF